jgi:hypothetical protein
MLRCASLFSQVLSLINRHQFAAAAKTFRAEKGAKGFSCWDQFVAMLFCQLAQAKSLREIVQGLLCCEGKLHHLGVRAAPKRATLSYANAHRPWKLFEAVFYQVAGAVSAGGSGSHQVSVPEQAAVAGRHGHRVVRDDV